MLQAMNTGHDGSLSTGHGNSPKDMLSRLETMVLMAEDFPLKAIRQQISSSIDILVHLAKLKDKTEKIEALQELLPQLLQAQLWVLLHLCTGQEYPPV